MPSPGIPKSLTIEYVGSYPVERITYRVQTEVPDDELGRPGGPRVRQYTLYSFWLRDRFNSEPSYLTVAVEGYETRDRRTTVVDVYNIQAPTELRRSVRVACISSTTGAGYLSAATFTDSPGPSQG